MNILQVNHHLIDMINLLGKELFIDGMMNIYLIKKLKKKEN